MTDVAVASRARGEGSVHRSFALLRLLVAAGEPLGVRELSRRSGLSKSAVSRLLATLAEIGMVERTADGGARPGAGLATLTRRVEHTPALLRERLRPLTADMLRQYDENAAVGIDDGNGFLYLASARVPAAVQVADPVGETFPFHLVAPGLVAMAAWPAARLDEYLAAPLEGGTPRTVTDPDAVRERLARIRRDGYAWTDQDLDLEVNGLAAPIRDGSGDQVAVATLYGPSYRLSEQLLPDLGAQFAEFVEARNPLA